MQIPSKFLERAVDEIASLPGIGRRTALRLALHIHAKDPREIQDLMQAITELKSHTHDCSSCGNLSDTPVCFICQNVNRDHETICVVEDIRDIMALESTQAFKGVYHVLGGVISPMDGIGPQDLNVESLVKRVQNQKIKELIFALSPTMEGDTTNYYLYKKLNQEGLLITTLSRGVSVGTEIQYADEITLGKSLQQRQVFKWTS